MSCAYILLGLKMPLYKKNNKRDHKIAHVPVNLKRVKSL
jgi:hypothetical protein